MMRFRPCRGCVVLWLVASLQMASLSGCGRGGPDQPDTVKVSGKVTFNGEPLTTGQVAFVPENPQSGRPAFGMIDTTGAYVMSTFEDGDGLIPGRYRISVNAVKEGDPDDFRTRGGTRILPNKYYDANKSELTADVEESGSQTFDFELSGQPGK